MATNGCSKDHAPDCPRPLIIEIGSSLIEAVAKTRDARGTLAVAQLSDLTRNLGGRNCKASFAHIRVWPERADPTSTQCTGNFSQRPRAVSMTWWLSTPVQYHLFDEIEGTKTCNQDALTLTWHAIEMNSDCVQN
jgi:hypothetical protein